MVLLFLMSLSGNVQKSACLKLLYGLKLHFPYSMYCVPIAIRNTYDLILYY